MALKLSGVPKTLGVDYQSHLVTKPLSGQVSTSKSLKGDVIASSTEQSQVLHPGVFSDGMSITVEGGRTINLGNYESAKVGVTITVPCDNTSLNEAYVFATEWISAKIDEAVKLAKG